MAPALPPGWTWCDGDSVRADGPLGCFCEVDDGLVYAHDAPLPVLTLVLRVNALYHLLSAEHGVQ